MLLDSESQLQQLPHPGLLVRDLAFLHKQIAEN